MAHHGSPDGGAHPGGPAADQPTQAQPAASAYPQQPPAYQEQQGYGVPQQPVPTHDQGSTGAYAPNGYGQPEQGTQASYSFASPPAPSGYDQGYAQPQPGPSYGQPQPDQGYGQPQPGQGYGQPDQAYTPTGFVPQQSAFGAPTQQTGYVTPTPGYGDRPMSAPPVSSSPLIGAPTSAPPVMSAPPGSGAPGYPTGQFGAQPVTGQPAYGQPGYGQPAYGQPGYPSAIDPVTGMPITGAPVAKKKRGIAVPLLAGFLALAVIAAGIFVGLYFDKSNKLNKADKVVAQQKQDIADRDADLKKTKSDLQDKTDQLSTAQQDLRGTQADNTETKREKDLIAKCLTLIDAALAATSNADFESKWKALQDPCKQADAVLGL
jgi:hypothetical protein